RSHFTTLLYNDIEGSNEGEVSLVDSPDTRTPNSNAVLIGNLIVSKASRTGSPSKFIDFGEDTGGAHTGTLYLVNNTMMAGTPSIAFVLTSDPGASVVATNNIFYGSDKIIGWNFGGITGSNNWVQSTATVPPGFWATMRGTDPGFVSPATG